jgi:hypothetical protein
VPNGVKKRKSFVKISLHKKTSVQYCGLKNGRYNVDIREKEREEREKKMRMIEMITSDCCGDKVQGYDFCACCLEHCTPILEYYPDPSDPESAPSK